MDGLSKTYLDGLQIPPSHTLILIRYQIASLHKAFDPEQQALLKALNWDTAILHPREEEYPKWRRTIGVAEEGLVQKLLLDWRHMRHQQWVDYEQNAAATS